MCVLTHQAIPEDSEQVLKGVWDLRFFFNQLLEKWSKTTVLDYELNFKLSSFHSEYPHCFSSSCQFSNFQIYTYF